MEYDIFREKLALKYPAYGHALWQPSPGVEIGDVGFIRGGHFHCLFNVLPPKANCPDRSVPPNHKPFKIGNSESPPTHSSTLQANHFCSRGVSMGYAGLRNVPDEYTFSCSTGQGAILSLPVSAQCEDILAKDEFGEYMLRHIEEWFTFARGRGMGICRREDIVLVTGRDLAKSWANIVFREGDGDMKFEARVTGDSRIEWKFTPEGARGVAHAIGPNGNLKDLPENQCIFVRGFRVTRIAKILPRLRAAAGPAQVPSEDNLDADSDMQLISIPGDTQYHDPFYTLLKYIAIQAPGCDMALLHDDDLQLCIDGASLDSLQPDTFMTFLRKSAPKVWQVEWDCSPTFHSASTAEALPQAAAVKVAMFVNREVEHEHINSSPESLDNDDRILTPYNASTPEPVVTRVVTEKPSVPSAAPPSQPHRDEGVQLEGSGDDFTLDPMDPRMVPLPPPLTNFVPTETWETFEQRQILESLRSQAEPQAHDREELSAIRRQAAKFKSYVLSYQHFRPQQIQPSHLVELGYAWCRLKILLWRTFPINNLPFEIVINIFHYVVWSTKDSPEGILSRFRLTWVCQRWRHLAVCDQTLWNTIWFRDAKVGYQRSVMYFERAGLATLDLRIEDDDTTRLIPAQPMTGEDMERILDIIMTKSNQIRMLIVVVEAWPPILVLLDRLHRSSRSLSQFERIEIHRTGSPSYLDGPNYPPDDYQDAFTLCDGRTERLNFLCLNGVHIDWDKSRFANLVNLDLRRMPPDLGPSLERFRCILENSPNLKKLSLDGAGPVMPPGPASHSIHPVSLPRLESLVLGDVLISYAVFCAEILHCPNVRELIILNIVGEDHAPLLKALTGKLPELLILTLYCVNIEMSAINERIVTQWLLSIPKIKFMRVAEGMKPPVLDHFFVDGRLHIRDDIPLVLKPEEKEAILAEGSRITLCPELEAIEVQHVDMESVVHFVFGRRRDGVPLRKLYVHHNWLQDMKLEEKAMLEKQKYEHEFVNVTVPASLTPVEEAIWMHVKTTR